jgi:filamentous hemagglutinin family protein
MISSLSRFKSAVVASLVLAFLVTSGALQAQPSGGQVVAGEATIVAGDRTTTITAGNQAVLRWDSFDVPTGDLVQFVQPNADARVLNWIGGQAPSQIDGTLRANGQVYLMNSAGIYFGRTAVVDVGGLYAVGGSLSKEDFFAGLNRFTDLTGSVQNEGTLQGNLVALVGRSIVNTGRIIAPDGFVGLAAGDQVYLRGEGSRIRVEAGRTADASNGTGTGVLNRGEIQAGEGSVVFAAGDLYAVAIAHEGRLSARQTRLEGQGRGQVNVSGQVDASSVTGSGGSVVITGEQVAVGTGAVVDASGAAGGGSILIGGDYLGGNADIRNARQTSVAAGATLRANATVDGDGGRVIVWADGVTSYAGFLSARGGPGGGDGGFAEVSGKGLLQFSGSVDLLAPQGRGGALLLDPTNILIRESNPDLEGDGGSLDVTAAGIAADDFGNVTSIITAGQVSTLLQNTGSVSLAAGSTITVDHGITWSSTNSLTLLAGYDINVNAALTHTGAAGGITLQADTGRIALAADVTSTGGMVNLNGPVEFMGTRAVSAGSIIFASTINGASNVSLSGALTFGGTIGGMAQLSSLTINSGSTVNLPTTRVDGPLSITSTSTNLTGNVTATGAATFTGAVTSSGSSVLAAGSIAFQGTGDVGASDARVAVSSATVTLDKSSGADVFLRSDRDSGVTVSGTAAGANAVVDITSRNAANSGDAALTVGAGGITASGAGSSVTLVSGALALAGGITSPTVTLTNSGSLTGAGLVNASTSLTLGGGGTVGASDALLPTNLGALIFAKSGGSSFISNTGGLSLSGSSGGDMNVRATGPISISSSLTASGQSIRLVADGGISQAGTLTAAALSARNSGSGNINLMLGNDVGTFAAHNGFATGSVSFRSNRSGGFTIGSVADAGASFEITRGISTSDANITADNPSGKIVITETVRSFGSGNDPVQLSGVEIGQGVQIKSNTGRVVALTGSFPDTIFNGAFEFASETLISASRDIIINGAVTALTGDTLTLLADSDNNGVGGVLVTGSGSLLVSAGALTITGSSIFDSAGDGKIFYVASGGTVTAAGNVSVGRNLLAPVGNGISLFGNASAPALRSLGGSLSINPGTGSTLLAGTTLAQPLLSASTTVTFGGRPVLLSGSSRIQAATTTFASTLDGAGTLSLSGAGVFTQDVGGSVAIASLIVDGPATIAGNITATNGLTFNGVTSLTSGDNQTLTAGSGTLATTSTLTKSGSAHLTLNGSHLSIGGAVNVADLLQFNGTVALGADVTALEVVFNGGVTRTAGVVTASNLTLMGNGDVGEAATNGRLTTATSEIHVSKTGGAATYVLNRHNDLLWVGGTAGGNGAVFDVWARNQAGASDANLRVRGDHLIAGGANSTIRLWGANLSFWGEVAAAKIALGNSGTLDYGTWTANTLAFENSGAVGSFFFPFQSHHAALEFNKTGGAAVYVDNYFPGVTVTGTTTSGGSVLRVRSFDDWGFSAPLTIGAAGLVNNGAGSSTELVGTTINMVGTLESPTIRLDHSGVLTPAGTLTASSRLTLAGSGNVGSSASALAINTPWLVIDKPGGGDVFVNNGTSNLLLTPIAFTGSGGFFAGDLTLAGQLSLSGPLTFGTESLFLSNHALSATEITFANNGPLTGSNLIFAQKLVFEGTGNVGGPGSRLIAFTPLVELAKTGGADLYLYLRWVSGVTLSGSLSGTGGVVDVVVRDYFDLNDQDYIIGSGGLTAADAATITVVGRAATVTGDLYAVAPGSSVTLRSTSLTLNGNISSDHVTLHHSGSLSGNGTLTADTKLTLAGTGTVGSSLAFQKIATPTLELNKSAGSVFVDNQGSALGVLPILFTARGEFLAGDITLLGNLNSAGNILHFVGDSIALGAHAVTGGVVTFNHSGALSGSGVVSANELRLQGTGQVGSSGQRLTFAAPSLQFTKAGGDAFLNATGAVGLSGSTAGALDLTSASPITNPAALTVGGGLTIDAGNAAITLNHGSNNFSTVTAKGGSITLVDQNALTLGTIDAAGNLNITTGGTLTGTGAVNVTGTTQLNTTASISLTDTGNTFGATMSFGLNPASLTLVADGAVTLGALTVGGGSGALSITAGSLGQTGAIWAGATTLSTGTGAITLTHANNLFGDLTLTAGTVSLREAGAITDGGTWNTGTTTLHAGGHAITLDSANSITGVLHLTGGAVSVSRDGAVQLGDVSASTLQVSSAAGIAGAGQILAGATTLDAGTANISLTNVNNVIGDLTLTGNSVMIFENDAITDGGAWNTGEVTLNAGGHAITLNASGSTTDRLHLNGGAVTVARDAAIGLGAVNASSLSLTSLGGISGSVAIQTGDTFLDAGNAAISLTDSENRFGDLIVRGGSVAITENDAITDGGAWHTGVLTLDSGSHAIVLDATSSTTGLLNLKGGDVTISRNAAIELGSVDAATLSLTSSGGISGTVAIQTGATYLDAGSSAITLTDAGNVFGDLTVRGGTVAITENDVITDGGAWSTGEVFLNAGTYDILLDHAGSTTDLLHLTGGHVFVSRDAAITLGAVNASTLNLASQGGISGTVAIQTGATWLDAGSAAISLTHANNVFGDLTVRGGLVEITENDAITDGGAWFTGATILNAGNNAIVLDEALNQLGDLTLTAGSVMIRENDAITDGGAWTTGEVSLHAGGHDITLDAAHSTTGRLNLNGGAVSVSRQSAIELGAVNADTLSLTSSQGISGTVAIQTGATYLDAGSAAITLTHAGNVFGDLTVRGGTVAITENDSITDGGAWATGETFLNAGAHAIVLDAAGSTTGLLHLTGGNVFVSRDAAIILGAVHASTLDLASAGGIAGTVAIQTGATSLDAGHAAITLTNSGNVFGDLTVKGGTVAITENDAITDGGAWSTGATILDAGAHAIVLDHALNVLGDLTLTASSVTITENDAITDGGAWTTGDVSLHAGTHAIVLDAAGSTTGLLNLTGGDVLVSRDAAIVLGAVNATTLSLTSSSGISGTVAIQTGATHLDAGASTISLTHAGNVFGDLTVRGGDVAITENDAITDGGAWSTGEVTLNAGNHAITLDAAASTTGLLNLTGGAVTVSRDAAIVLGAVEAATLSLTSAGGISGTRGIQTGATFLDAGTAAITLTHADNVFGDLTVRGGTVAITENDAITDGGAWSTGEVTLNAGGHSIVLDAVGSTTGRLNLTAGSVAINRSAAIELGAVHTRSLALTSHSGITGTVAIQTGDTFLDAGSGVISLTHAANVFGDLTVRGGTVAITENDAITDGGAWLTGATTLDAGGHAINLDNAGNRLGDLTLRAGSVAITEDDAITQGAAWQTGTTVLDAGGHRIVLDQVGNVLGELTFRGGEVRVTEADAITLAGASRASTLSLRSASGISNVAGTSLEVAGKATIDAGSQAIALGNHGGDQFNFGSLALTGGTIEVSEQSSMLVAVEATGAVTLRGAGVELAGVSAPELTVISSGAIHASAATVVAGSATFDAGEASVLLDHPENDFGRLSLRGSEIVVHDRNGVAIDAVQATTGVEIVARDDIEQAGDIELTGMGEGGVRLTSSQGSIIMDSGAVTRTDGGAVYYEAADDLRLGQFFTGGGRVEVRAGQGIQFFNELRVSGEFLAEAGAGGIRLDHAIEGEGAEGRLTLVTPGSISFRGAIGRESPLGTLTAEAGEAIRLNGGAINIANAAHFLGHVVLGSDTAISAGSLWLADGASGFSDGGQALALRVHGDAVIGGPLGRAGARLQSIETAGAGRVIFSGGEVATTLHQTYGNAVQLGAATRFEATDLTFGRSVDSRVASGDGISPASGPSDLTLAVSGVATFGGPVGEGSRLGAISTEASGRTVILGDVAATSAHFAHGVTIDGATARIETSGSQRFDEAVELKVDLSFISTGADVALHRGVQAVGRKLHVDAKEGTLLIGDALGSESGRLHSVRADAKNIIVENIFTTGDLQLAIGTDAGTASGTRNAFLQINGTTLNSESGAIVLGSGALTPDQAGDDKTGAPFRSSIFKSNAGDLILVGDTVTIQPFERLAVRDGSLIIFADQRITLSNTAVSQTLALIAPQIHLRSRGAQPVVTSDRGPDQDRGTEIVGAKVLLFRGGSPGAPTRSNLTTFDYASSQGNILSNLPEVVTVAPGTGEPPQMVYIADLTDEKSVLRPLIPHLVYLDLRTAAGLHDAPVVPPIRFGNEGETPVFSLIAAGQLRANLEQAYVPVLPRQAQAASDNEAALAPAVREQLQALGIFARALTDAEQEARRRRAGLFVAVPARERPRESDYEVVDARIEETSIREVLRLAEVNGLVGAQSERLAAVAHSLAIVYDDYQRETAIDDGAQFRRWLERRSDAHSRRVVQFVLTLEAMFRQIESLGLTRQELDISKAQIYGSILMPRLNADPEFLRAMIEAPASAPSLADATAATPPAGT